MALAVMEKILKKYSFGGSGCGWARGKAGGAWWGCGKIKRNNKIASEKMLEAELPVLLNYDKSPNCLIKGYLC